MLWYDWSPFLTAVSIEVKNFGGTLCKDEICKPDSTTMRITVIWEVKSKEYSNYRRHFWIYPFSKKKCNAKHFSMWKHYNENGSGEYVKGTTTPWEWKMSYFILNLPSVYFCNTFTILLLSWTRVSLRCINLRYENCFINVS